MENNNGRGIFYGVIGVATLVVAIIGATFAYFSATVTRNTITNVGSTSLNLSYTAGDSVVKTDMIPVETQGQTITEDDETGVKTSVANGTVTPGTHDLFYKYPGTSTWTQKGDKFTCVDDNGNSICSVYEFTISNPSPTTSQTVIGSITAARNGFTNLRYALFKGSVAQLSVNNVGYNVNGDATQITASTAVGTVIEKGVLPAVGVTDTWDNTDLLLAADGGSVTYTIVIWLEDNGLNQEDETNQRFSASITFTSDNGGGVTGVLSA